MRKYRSPRDILFFIALLGVVILIGLLDYLTGAEFAFSIFYFLPVGFAAWHLGFAAGLALSVESAFVWYYADLLARTEPYPQAFIPAWNAGVRLITFLIVTILINTLRDMLRRESVSARIDYLTGAANARSFYEILESKIAQFHRHPQPFAVLYLDVDNLKELNDAQGHSAGDRMLQATVAALKKTLRPGDTVARLGGDEFAVLLSDVDARASETVSTRVQSRLRDNPGKEFGVTYSIGVLACLSEPDTADKLIRRADNLMYAAKRSGKDRFLLASFADGASPGNPAGRTDQREP